MDGRKLLHIARQQDWDRAQELGTYELPGGVIHGCSTSQLAMVASAHFPEVTGFVLLSIAEEAVSGEIRSVTYREASRSETFPHLHGTFPVSAVLDVRPLAVALAEHPR